MQARMILICAAICLGSACAVDAAEERDARARLSGAIHNERILMERLEQNRRYAAAAYLANKALMETTLDALSVYRGKDESYKFRRQDIEAASRLLAVQDETMRRLEYYQDKEASIDERIDESLKRIERLRERLDNLPRDAHP